jgi:predicted lipoprotein with Yx(FWY)xxD motif
MLTALRRLTLTKTVISLAIIGTSVGVSPLLGGAPASAASKTSATVITARQGPFGTMLIVGAGKYAGYTVYIFTGDGPSDYACTPTIVKSLPGGPGSCTGPSSDQKAEWPALTTTGAPVAGAGVNQSLLGSVARTGIGDQVTYGGHPLYLFDQSPGSITGEGWDEPSLPPWHGLWWLVSPSGAPLAWPETLTTTHIGARTVLAATMLTGIGWEEFPVYTYTKDAAGASNCSGPCAIGWPPLLTNGSPALEAGLTTAGVGTLKRADGTTQLTYKGRPLYLFAYEGIAPQGMQYVATGNGAGAKVGGGVFDLVSA